MCAALVEIVETPGSGRGIYATSSIVEGTRIIPPSSLSQSTTATRPFAYVILRKFRKEVCGWCFKYSWDAGKGKWIVRNDAIKGAWFCCSECMDEWIRDYQFNSVERGFAIKDALDVFEKICTGSLKSKGKASNDAEPVTPIPDMDSLDRSWDAALGSRVPLGDLAEEELNMARFVLEGIIRRWLQESFPSQSATGQSSGTWSDLLTLQSSEPHLLQSNPLILNSHIRIYRTLLRNFASSPLRKYLDAPDTTRAILTRHHSNAFGIWEESDNEKSGAENEMLGYGLWVGGGESMFNHDCTPSVKKRRQGRELAFYTVRDIEKGEQICTNYVDVKLDVHERRKQLKEWGFDCLCSRCSSELASQTQD